MNTVIRPAITLFVALSILTGVAYPALVTGIAQGVFAHQANGSLIEQGGKDGKGSKALGSELIGQDFDAPRYFWGRLSATTPNPYNAAASSGSNLGPLNPALVDAVKARIAALHEVDPGNNALVPVDLVTASASGLDPDISPAAAYYQMNRVARLRGLSEGAIRELVLANTTGRTWGVLGEPHVNVLKLNIALDRVSAVN